MSYLKTVPEALAAAATQLEGIGNSFSAESAAAAAPTTDIIPAAADEVSVLQAGVFTTYGQLYQTVSAQAQAIHQQFVNLLGLSSGSYGDTEAANQVAAASTPLSGLGSLMGGASSPASTAAEGPIEQLAAMINDTTAFLSGSPMNSNLANLGNIQVGNWASAGSDLIGMGGGGLLTALAADAIDAEAMDAGLMGAVAPAAASGVGAAGGLGGAPVMAGVGQAASLGALSVPPSWAAGAPGAGAPVTFAAQNWTTAAPHAGAVTTMPAGVPAAVAGGRGGMGYGVPRYGVKPKVMPLLPKPTLT
ncbi:PPE family protein, SVP subgroup [Mycobacterium shimoidei]|uniref:PE-PGRS family protein, triacylglycerol lipase LipY (Esterase/lipase) (Triglyceride lipase) (Tributyrase) [Mycobacterium tuberculosis H37Rv] n=1 Tax=Mycobacterium shimoidei TaxID=29313 RepID=A0A1E3TKW3_MYCSH|nr:PE domain-containing protein [Mycobacterium shimoidei]MCV7257381.1 PE domain-containing protein [Mycobacterium shimoidei]ODR14296.1 PE family protein [Mycobacterium shimoidei]ORW80373.1 PE family protein [Mycobacterium shimoidei]SRX95926.1 PE-PGRS family protein, triacylglycerol lipase LipY (esterase/lipase) (triglyceride lipase) (tributyrase) [Mycobacterium tuberculosis H37Rv] [Mycobacterium shimoidei]